MLSFTVSIRNYLLGNCIKKIKPITMIVLMTIIGIGGAYLGILGLKRRL